MSGKGVGRSRGWEREMGMYGRYIVDVYFGIQVVLLIKTNFDCVLRILKGFRLFQIQIHFTSPNEKYLCCFSPECNSLFGRLAKRSPFFSINGRLSITHLDNLLCWECLLCIVLLFLSFENKKNYFDRKFLSSALSLASALRTIHVTMCH